MIILTGTRCKIRFIYWKIQLQKKITRLITWLTLSIIDYHWLSLIIIDYLWLSWLLALLALLALLSLPASIVLLALLALLALPVSIVLLALLCDFWWSLLLSNWQHIAFLTQSYRFDCLSVNSSHMRHRSQCEASWGTPHISTNFQPENVKTNKQIVKQLFRCWRDTYSSEINSFILSKFWTLTQC